MRVNELFECMIKNRPVLVLSEYTNRYRRCVVRMVGVSASSFQRIDSGTLMQQFNENVKEMNETQRSYFMQHVYPLNDLIKHNTESIECPCNPDIDVENGIVIHSAMDRREIFEQNRG